MRERKAQLFSLDIVVSSVLALAFVCFVAVLGSRMLAEAAAYRALAYNSYVSSSSAFNAFLGQSQETGR